MSSIDTNTYHAILISMIHETIQNESEEVAPKKQLSTPQSIIVAALIVAVGIVLAFGQGKGTDTPKTQKLPENTYSLQEETEPSVAPSLIFDPTNPDEHILGSRDADVFLIEYSDIDCPYCRAFHSTISTLSTAYGTKVAWVYRQFPLTSLHPNAYIKAKATECVAMVAGNDKFWEYMKTLFETDVSPSALSSTAVSIGVNKEAFDSCMAGSEADEKIKEDQASGDLAGVRGTPFTAVINVKTKNQTTIGGALPFEASKETIESIF